MQQSASINSPIKLRGIDDVVSFIDSRDGINGRAGVIWWLALGGLFLDAFSNSALSAGLAPMTRDLHLAAAEVALLTSFASWVAIAFNPIGGWMADRWGRVRPLILAKVFAIIGGLLVSQVVTLYLTPVVYTYLATLVRTRRIGAPVTSTPATA